MIFEPETTGSATYCPESDKLHLYIGRVPRPEYDALRAEGWKSTPKQSENGGGEFAAVWTPAREDTALSYSPEGIDDEDQSPQDRAADRAERFAGYREKRAAEATGHADSYEAGPRIHGYQSQALAERRARGHDKIATRAVNQWEKAEYWQRRTAGVIGNALYKSGPGVRMGRIKILEAEQRKAEKSQKEYALLFKAWQKTAESDPETANKRAMAIAGSSHDWGEYKHPRPDEIAATIRATGHDRAEELAELYSTRETSLYTLLTSDYEPITGHEAAALWLGSHGEPTEGGGRWYKHRALRLAYENQMLESQGGRAAFVEMEPGGFLGERQIQKVNKSPATGRVVSVQVKVDRVEGYAYQVTSPNGADYSLLTIKTERMKAEVYRAPTDEERAAFLAEKKAAKKEQAKKPKGPSLINPTKEDAERLQTVWNEQEKGGYGEPGAVIECTQAQYSAASKGNYGRYSTEPITGGGRKPGGHYNSVNFPIVAKVRANYRNVVVITDKPQKAFPAAVWDDPRPAMRAEVLEHWPLLLEACTGSWSNEMTEEGAAIFYKARLVGLAYSDSMSQFGLSKRGQLVEAERKAKPEPEPEEPEKDPGKALREMWTAQGVPEEKQTALIDGVTAKAQPGAMVGPFRIPEKAPEPEAVPVYRDNPETMQREMVFT